LNFLPPQNILEFSSLLSYFSGALTCFWFIFKFEDTVVWSRLSVSMSLRVTPWPSRAVLADAVFAVRIRVADPSRPTAFAQTAAASTVGTSPPKPPPRRLPKLPRHRRRDTQGRAVDGVVHCRVAPLPGTTPPSVRQDTPSRRPVASRSNRRRHPRWAVEAVSPQPLHHPRSLSPLR
jgi:hypothetical protein